jgi:hypothetical protein
MSHSVWLVSVMPCVLSCLCVVPSLQFCVAGTPENLCFSPLHRLLGDTPTILEEPETSRAETLPQAPTHGAFFLRRLSRKTILSLKNSKYSIQMLAIRAPMFTVYETGISALRAPSQNSCSVVKSCRQPLDAVRAHPPARLGVCTPARALCVWPRTVLGCVPDLTPMNRQYVAVIFEEARPLHSLRCGMVLSAHMQGWGDKARPLHCHCGTCSLASYLVLPGAPCHQRALK